MERYFTEMTYEEVDKILLALGFRKIDDRVKKGTLQPYNLKEPEWRLVTYAHPNRTEKVKITIVNKTIAVESDCGMKQRTAWRPLRTVEELRHYFNL